MSFSNVIDFFENWIHMHSEWLLLFIMFVSFAESLAIIGVVIPGIALLFIAGTYVGKGEASLIAGIMSAWLGAFIGDTLSFLLGKFFHIHIREWSLFKKNKNWVNKGENFFFKYGSLSVFLGRFAGPVRAFIPLIAGMLGMSVVRFIIIDIIACFLWAIAYLFPGYLVGSATTNWRDIISIEYVSVLGIITLVSIFLSYYCNYFCDNRKHKRSYYLKASWILLISFFVWGLIDKLGLLKGLDKFIAYFFLHGETLWVGKINVLFTIFGSNVIQGFLMILIFGTIWVSESIKKAFLFGGCTFALIFVLSITKWLLDIPRPPNIAGKIGYSFPSGHVAITTYLLLVLADYVKTALKKNRSLTIIGLAFFVSFLIAVSRLCLGVHWFSDVVGAIVLGLSFFTLWLHFIAKEKNELLVDVKKLLIVLLLMLFVPTFIFCWGIYLKTSKQYLGF